MKTHRMRRRAGWTWALATGLAAAMVAAVVVSATAKTRLRNTLTATSHAPGASGLAKLVMRSGSNGRLGIKAKGLPGGQSFDVIVNNVKVGTLVTGASGHGVAKFSTSPKGRFAMLGFDPRGAHMAIREETGEDDLEGDMDDDTPESAIGCCVGEQDDDGEVECENLTATECQDEGGTPTGATTCLPNPCGNPPPTNVVCCQTTSAGGAFVDDDPEVECEEDVEDCPEEGGVLVEASSCDPNPCQPTPPPNLVICCVSDGEESECEHVTADHCVPPNGTVSTASSCDPDPCGGGSGGDGGGDD